MPILVKFVWAVVTIPSTRLFRHGGAGQGRAGSRQFLVMSPAWISAHANRISNRNPQRDYFKIRYKNLPFNMKSFWTVSQKPAGGGGSSRAIAKIRHFLWQNTRFTPFISKNLSVSLKLKWVSGIHEWAHFKEEYFSTLNKSCVRTLWRVWRGN